MARYSAAAGLLGQTENSSQNQAQIGASNTNTQQQQTTSGVSNTSGSSSSRETVNMDYLDPTARKALNDLISTLSKGGTPAQRQQMEQRLNEIVTNQAIRGQYSQANAFAQAEGAANSQLSKALQAALPQIAASVDSAGTSGSSFSGLLTQQAAADAANIAAEQGLQTSVAYGQIQAGLSGVLEQLTRGDQDPIVNGLIQALNIAKGSIESGSKTSSGSSSSTTIGSETTIGSSQQQQVNAGFSSANSTTTTNPNKNKSTASNNFSGLNTPSSNRNSLTQSAAYKPGKTSYSQFG